MIRRTLIIALLFVLSTALNAGNKPSQNKASTVVDQGSFGIFQNGRRVATENFTIKQYQDSSVTSSELIDENGKAQQTGDLTLLPNGAFSHYDWKQMFPVRSSVAVEAGDQFLVMHSLIDGKADDQSFFLSSSAFLLDDYIFSTREVLLWRYLATYCTPRPNGDGCDLVRGRFPVLIPRRRTSGEVFIEFKGFDDTPLNGRPQHLRHFILQSDSADWHLWVDANQKLLRISIPDANTEILRQEK